MDKTRIVIRVGFVNLIMGFANWYVILFFLSLMVLAGICREKNSKTTRYPQSKIAYVTSSPLDSAILDYYLSLVPNVTAQDARERLLVLSTYNNYAGVCLAKKILDHPRLMYRLKKFIHEKQQQGQDQKDAGTSQSMQERGIGNDHGAVLSVLRGTDYEEKIAKVLELPMYFAKNAMQYWGTKPGSRTCFRDMNIPHADGTYIACYSEEDLIDSMLPVL